MKTKRHTLTEIDEETRIAFCAACDTIVKIVSNGRPNSPSINTRWRCKVKFSDTWRKRNRPHTLHKKAYCEECLFVAKVASQLDVDHVDGNKANNDPDNLRTLCKNCHAYKTAMKGDWIPKKFSQSNSE